MIIDYIELQDFLPFYGSTNIRLPTDNFANTTVFYGENTKGKTSLLNAFRWVLYSAVESKKQKLSPKEIINVRALNEGKGSFSVEIKFEHNGVGYVIHRSASVDMSVGESNLAFKKNGEPLDRDSAEKEIQRIAPFETRRFFLFDGELLREYEELMDNSSSTARKIKEAIEDVMGIPSLKISHQIITDIRRSTSRDASNENAANSAVKKIQDEIDSLESAIEEDEISKEELSGILFRDEEQITRIDEALEENSSQLELYQEVKQMQAVQEVLNNEIEEMEEDISLQKRNLWKRIIRPEVESQLAELTEFEYESSAMRTERDKTQAKIEALLKLVEEKQCPTCGQKTEVSASITDELKNLNGKINEIDTALDSESQISPIWRELSLSFSDIDSLGVFIKQERKLEEHRIKFDSNSETIRTKTRELVDFDGEQQSRLHKKKLELVRAFEKNSLRLDALEEKIGEKKEKAKKAREELNKHLGKTAGKANERHEHVNKLEEAFEGAIGILREDIKGSVEEEASKAFSKLTSRPEDYIKLRITDSYGMEIVASDGGVVPARSAGAEQIVALALIDGLNRTGKSPGPVIMDTPFGRLDKTHRRKIMQYMPESARQFVVFVHSGEMEENSEVIDSIRDRIGKQYRLESNGTYESSVEEVI